MLYVKFNSQFKNRSRVSKKACIFDIKDSVSPLNPPFFVVFLCIFLFYTACGVESVSHLSSDTNVINYLLHFAYHNRFRFVSFIDSDFIRISFQNAADRVFKIKDRHFILSFSLCDINIQISCEVLNYCK